MKVKLKERKKIAENTILLSLDTLGSQVDFIPGQFFPLGLINPPYLDDSGSSKYFSVVNSPDEKGVLTIATRLRDSAFKKSLNEMPIGSELEIGEIMGDFTLPTETDKPLVLIAGGIGITPYISMLRYIRDNNLNYNIILIYSNQNEKSTPFLDELKGLEDSLPNFKLILIMTKDNNWTGEKNRIDSSLIKKYLPDFMTNLYYIVGAPGMVNGVFTALEEIGIGRENIKTENFPGY